MADPRSSARESPDTAASPEQEAAPEQAGPEQADPEHAAGPEQADPEHAAGPEQAGPEQAGPEHAAGPEQAASAAPGAVPEEAAGPDDADVAEQGADSDQAAGAEQGARPEQAAGPDEADIAEQAAALANEASEAQSPQQRRRLAERFAAARRAVPESAPVSAARSAALSAARATGRGVRATGRGVRAARRGAGGGTGWLAGQVMAMALRLRVRNQAALRAQFPGLSAEEIADALVEGASRASAAVGGAVGAWAALPVLPAFPAEVATETLALVGIEIKLVAELHEAYGVPAPGSLVDRMSAYVAAWANRRGVAMVPGGVILAAGSPLARRLRWRLAGRAGRTAFSLAPLLTGAAAGAVLNRRETRRLGEDVRADLRRYAGR